MIIKEFNCKAHGDFESDAPYCPQGCSTEAERVFLTPPSYLSDKTKSSDGHLKQLAFDFKMTNMTNDGGRRAVMSTCESDVERKLNSGFRPMGANIQSAVSGFRLPIGDNVLNHPDIKHRLRQPTPMVMGRYDAKVEA